MTIAELYQVYLIHPQINTDTRKITEGCLFFALRGEHEFQLTRHRFTDEAIKKSGGSIF